MMKNKMEYFAILLLTIIMLIHPAQQKVKGQVKNSVKTINLPATLTFNLDQWANQSMLEASSQIILNFDTQDFGKWLGTFPSGTKT